MKRNDILKLSSNQIDRVVKIQGTQFDRKRKLTDRQVARIKRLLKNGVSYKALSEIFGVTIHTLKYNTNPAYRECAIQSRSGKHYGKPDDVVERAEYKRKLVKRRRVAVN